jgi:hypothetical protein
LKEMVGTRRLELLTPPCQLYNDLQQPRGLPKYAEVAHDIAFCGLVCGLEFLGEAALCARTSYSEVFIYGLSRPTYLKRPYTASQLPVLRSRAR